jgi:hypothetical protein
VRGILSPIPINSQPFFATDKGDGGDAPVEEQALSTEEENTFLLRQIESLKAKLIMQTNRTSAAETAVKELRTKLFDLQKDYEEEKVTQGRWMQTQRQTDRQADKQIYIQAGRQTGRHAGKHADRHGDRQTHRHTTHRHTDTQTNRHTDRQTDTQTDR